jgi:hypothetical protein
LGILVFHLYVHAFQWVVLWLREHELLYRYVVLATREGSRMKTGLAVALTVAACAVGCWYVVRKCKDLSFDTSEDTSPGWWVKGEGNNEWYHVWEDTKTKNIYRNTKKGMEVYHDGKWERSCFQ